MPIKSVGHVGFCVSDLDRSLRFWCEGLGFEVLREFEFYGSSWKRVLELDDLDLQTRIIRRDDMMLEILHFRKPGTLGTRERSPMNQLGFTHLAIWVNDIDEVAQRVPAAKSKKPEDFVNTRFLKELEQEGFFKQLK